jgi:signal transduction histidine kinase
VTIEEPAGPTDSKAWQVTILVIGLALLAAVAAIVLAVRQARRLAAPLDGLAEHAYELGSGEFAPATRVSGIPEVDAVSRVLDRSAAQIGALVTLQREFASDAAHQLRTPLTGIGLRLEEISRIGEPVVTQEAEAALGQVERLNRVITTLLARARGDAADPSKIDLASLLQGEAELWHGVLQQEGRELVLETVPGAIVYARREPLIGILTSLLDNALEHGHGEVAIRLTRQRDEVSLSVRDEGPGVPAELRSAIFNRTVSGHQGTGIGLALARSLALGEGGTLTLSADSPAELILRLPAVRDGQPVIDARRAHRAPHPDRS